MNTEAAGSSDSELFYNGLVPFHDFAAFVELDAYESVPDNWWVMVADVEGSTRAIDEGRYKDVNMVGAASVTAVLNICGDIQVLFVFGGDGGTILVPGSLRQAASDALVGLQAISQSVFGLALRVGAFGVSDLRGQGADVWVRKYQLGAGNYLAMFAGGGVELCDTLLTRGATDSPYPLAARRGCAQPDGPVMPVGTADAY